MKIRILLPVLTFFAFAACQQAPAPDPATDALKKSAETAARNKASVLKAYELVNARKFDEFVQLVTEDHADHAAMPEAKGREALKKNMMDFVAAFPDFKIESRQMLAEGDWVMGWVNISGTFQNDFMGIKANGKSFKISDVDILKFNADGLALEHWAVQDYCAMFSQLGVSPPAAPAN